MSLWRYMNPNSLYDYFVIYLVATLLSIGYMFRLPHIFLETLNKCRIKLLNQVRSINSKTKIQKE